MEFLNDKIIPNFSCFTTMDRATMINPKYHNESGNPPVQKQEDMRWMFNTLRTPWKAEVVKKASEMAGVTMEYRDEPYGCYGKLPHHDTLKMTHGSVWGITKIKSDFPIHYASLCAVKEVEDRQS